jgi:hypothetical protein
MNFIECMGTGRRDVLWKPTAQHDSLHTLHLQTCTASWQTRNQREGLQATAEAWPNTIGIMVPATPYQSIIAGAHKADCVTVHGNA